MTDNQKRACLLDLARMLKDACMAFDANPVAILAMYSARMADLKRQWTAQNPPANEGAARGDRAAKGL
jgi:hypothetical protein